MSTCKVFIATSLDGFISLPDGGIDWLNQANALVPAGEDCGFSGFMAGIDALVMGRHTFEQVLTFGAWPYGDTPIVVLSRTLASLPAHLPASVSLSAEEPALLVQRLSAAGLNCLYVDGGQTIQSFLSAGLVNEITLTLIPILLGQGKTLFGPLDRNIQLELVSSRTWDFGFVQVTYRVLDRI
jgi:dihydrofolate reductase